MHTRRPRWSPDTQLSAPYNTVGPFSSIACHINKLARLCEHTQKSHNRTLSHTSKIEWRWQSGLYPVHHVTTCSAAPFARRVRLDAAHAARPRFNLLYVLEASLSCSAAPCTAKQDLTSRQHVQLWRLGSNGEQIQCKGLQEMGACKAGWRDRRSNLSVQRAAAMGMRVAPESLMRPAASPFGHASCASSAYHCGLASLAAALAANTAARPAQDHLCQIRTSPLTNDWTSALLQMHHSLCPVICCRSAGAPSAVSHASVLSPECHHADGTLSKMYGSGKLM